MVTKVSGRAEKILRETQAPYLVAEERAELAQLLARLEKECPDEIERVILYGSKARGNADLESDVDLLIVVKDDAERIKGVLEKFRKETDSGIVPFLFSSEEYHRYQRLKLPLYVNIRRDGIELWDENAWENEERNVPLDFAEGEFRAMNQDTREAYSPVFRYVALFLGTSSCLEREVFARCSLSRLLCSVSRDNCRFVCSEYCAWQASRCRIGYFTVSC